jgi:hypothetical protein
MKNSEICTASRAAGRSDPLQHLEGPVPEDVFPQNGQRLNAVRSRPRPNAADGNAISRGNSRYLRNACFQRETATIG